MKTLSQNSHFLRQIIYTPPMKISREQKLAALGHSDVFVRSTILSLFGKDRDRGPDVTLRAVAAVDRYGWDAAFEFPHQLIDLALDAATAPWLLRQIGDDSPEGPDDRTKLHLIRWLSRAPLELVEKYLPEIARQPVTLRERAIFGDRGTPSALETARRRLELAAETPEHCLALFEEKLAACARATKFPRNQIDDLELIGEQLCAQNVLSDATVLDWLAFDFEQEFQAGHWRAGVALPLAGYLELNAAAPRAIELFAEDWDWWNEEIQKSLIATGSREALACVLENYPRQEWRGRLYLTGVIEDLRFPEAEPEVLLLLETEGADDLRVNLGVALARYGTPDSMRRAREIYAGFPGDPERFHIAETLYALNQVLGIDDPDTALWRARLEEYARRSLAASLHHLNIPKPNPAKIAGRNDPCPCGSGKKFKKCCLAALN